MEAQGRRARAREQRARFRSAVDFTAMAATLIATITLLGLASHTRSPGGENLQTQQGACHNPDVFIALLAVSTARLGMCLIAKTWTVLRRRRREAADEERARVAGLELQAYLAGTPPYVNSLVNSPPGSPALSTRSLPLPQPPPASEGGATVACVPRPASAPGHRRSNSFATATPSPRSQSPQSAPPNLALPLSEIPPPAPTPPRRASFSLASRSPSGSLAVHPSTSEASRAVGPSTSCEASPAIGVPSESAASPHVTPSLALATPPTSPRQRVTPPSSSAASVASLAGALAYPPPPPAPSVAYSELRESKAERRRRRHKKWAATADVLATQVLGSMNIVHFVLWLIGSAVCFAQLPNVVEENCYTSAPLLWWPLMVTTILFGWLQALHYLYIVIGALIILVVSGLYIALCFIMGWPVHPIMGMRRPRTPQPERLTEDDLKECPIVAYLPDPSEPLPEPSIYEASKAESVHEGTSQSVASALLKKAMGLEAERSEPASPAPVEEPKGEPVPPGEADPARLGLPGVVLSAHQVTCAICQSSFVPPREVPGRELYEVERLRQLPCKHVFHVECVDNWLMNHSGICPYCSQNVKDMLKAKEEGGEGAGQRQRPGEAEV